MLKKNGLFTSVYIWIKYLLIFCFLLILSISHAQLTEKEDVGAVIELLKEELEAAGANIGSLHLGTTPKEQGFFIDLVPGSQTAKYNLTGKPHDAFFIKATNRSVHIASESVEGLRNGAYWYLRHLGFRYYFPNAVWYVRPELKSVYVPIEETVSPSYESRRIWYAYGTGSKLADKDFKKWSEANFIGGKAVNAGHSYDGIINRNKTVFLQHPEYFAQKVKKGEIPRGPKFEVANEELVQLVIRDALSQVQDAIKKKQDALLI